MSQARNVCGTVVRIISDGSGSYPPAIEFVWTDELIGEESKTTNGFLVSIDGKKLPRIGERFESKLELLIETNPSTDYLPNVFKRAKKISITNRFDTFSFSSVSFDGSASQISGAVKKLVKLAQSRSVPNIREELSPTLYFFEDSIQAYASNISLAFVDKTRELLSNRSKVYQSKIDKDLLSNYANCSLKKDLCCINYRSFLSNQQTEASCLAQLFVELPLKKRTSIKDDIKLTVAHEIYHLLQLSWFGLGDDKNDRLKQKSEQCADICSILTNHALGMSVEVLEHRSALRMIGVLRGENSYNIGTACYAAIQAIKAGENTLESKDILAQSFKISQEISFDWSGVDSLLLAAAKLLNLVEESDNPVSLEKVSFLLLCRSTEDFKQALTQSLNDPFIQNLKDSSGNLFTQEYWKILSGILLKARKDAEKVFCTPISLIEENQPQAAFDLWKDNFLQEIDEVKSRGEGLTISLLIKNNKARLSSDREKIKGLHKLSPLAIDAALLLNQKQVEWLDEQSNLLYKDFKSVSEKSDFILPKDQSGMLVISHKTNQENLRVMALTPKDKLKNYLLLIKEEVSLIEKSLDGENLLEQALYSFERRKFAGLACTLEPEIMKVLDKKQKLLLLWSGWGLLSDTQGYSGLSEDTPRARTMVKSAQMIYQGLSSIEIDGEKKSFDTRKKWNAVEWIKGLIALKPEISEQTNVQPSNF